MKSISMFKIQSVVVMGVFTLLAGLTLSSSRAFADTTPVDPLRQLLANCLTKHASDGGGENPECKSILDTIAQSNGSVSTSRCKQVYDQLLEAKKATKGISQATLNRYNKCFGEEADEGGNESDLDLDSRDAQEDCSKHLTSTTCNEMNAGTLTDLESSEKDAKSTLRDAQKDANEAQDKITQAQKNGQRLQKEAKDDLTKANDSYELKVQDLQNKLLDALKAADQAAKQQAAQIRAHLIDLKKQAVAQTDRIRDGESAITNAMISVNAQCRTEAKAARDKQEDTLNAKDAADKAAGVKYNYSPTTLAGSINRKDAKRTAKIQTVYLNTYKDCLAGLTAAGAAAAAAIQSAQNALTQTKKSVNDQIKLLEDQQAEDMKALVDLQTSTADAKASQKANIDLQMNAATKAYNQATAQANDKFQYAQQDMQSDLQSAQRSLQLAMQNQSDAQNSLTTASTRVNCASSHGGRLSSDALSKLEEKGDLKTNLDTIISTCPVALGLNTCPTKDPNRNQVESICGTSEKPSAIRALDINSTGAQ